LNKIKSPYLNNINIVFSDISHYSDLQVLTAYLQTLQTPVTIYVHYYEVTENITILDKLTAENFTVKIICEADNDLKNVLSVCKNTLYQYDFLIKSEKEYNICEQIIDDLEIENCTVIPVFDDNLHFFENNVFISEYDILETKLNKREIFAHQAVNTNFFGTLTALPCGKVYSNPNFKPIGTIYDSIYDLIMNEFHKNNSWRVIRNGKPCCKCIYQWLCPSPSNYEFVIGKMNLCNVVLE
jgi:pseudo-rSAM protein